MSVFDNVDRSGLRVLDLHAFCETTGVHGRIWFYIIHEELGLRKFNLDRLLDRFCKEAIERDRVLNIYVLDEVDEQIFADNEVDEEGNTENDTDSSNGDWSENDSEYDEADDDQDYYDNIDESAEWMGENTRDAGTSKDGAGEGVKAKNIRTWANFQGSESDESNNNDEIVPDSEDELESLHESDEEDINKCPVFNPEKDMYDPPLQPGLKFSNFVECKQAV